MAEAVQEKVVMAQRTERLKREKNPWKAFDEVRAFAREVEYDLWAIVTGLVISNTVGLPRAFQAGVATYEFWLKAGIVLLGSRFLLISLLDTLGFFTKPQFTSLVNLSRWAFLLTFAGVGLRTSFRELGKQGWRPFAVGAVGEVFIVLVTLGLVYGADRFLHL